jgi:hypothetical protein
MRDRKDLIIPLIRRVEVRGPFPAAAFGAISEAVARDEFVRFTLERATAISFWAVRLEGSRHGG